MTNPPLRPRYPRKPIRTLAALAAALSIAEEELVAVAEIASAQYRPARPTKKSDGTVRQPFDARPRLKRIQRKVKERLLCVVEFPEFLTGSIRGRSVKKNALLHQGAAIVVAEDIAGFFPSTTAEAVYNIWKKCLGFSDDVARLLTALTTKDGFLPEGAATSSYLANLVFWDCEGLLHSRLAQDGVAYSRYVDDVTLSSQRPLGNTQLKRFIGLVYGMFRSRGYDAKRCKHEISRGNGPMLATKLVVNRRPAMSSGERGAIRAAVFQLEVQALNAPPLPLDFRANLNSVAGRVVRLAQFHATEGERLKLRVGKLRTLSA